MFNSMIESTRHAPADRFGWAVPVSMGVHLVAVGALALVSVLAAQAIVGPPPVVTFTPVLTAPPPPPAPPPPAAASAPQVRQDEPIPEPEPIDQPKVVPDAIDTVSPPGADSGVVRGIPNGVPGGVLNGVPSGDPRGVPGGIPGGDPDAPAGSVPGEPLMPGVGDVTMPELIASSKVAPAYPEIARVSRTEGRVILKAVILKDGTVAELEVVRVVPERFGFAEAAEAAVRHWRYKPALQGKTPVDVYMTVVVDFDLK